MARLSGDFSAPESLRNTDFNHRSEFLRFSMPLFPPLQNGDNTHECTLESGRHVVTKRPQQEPGRREGQGGTWTQQIQPHSALQSLVPHGLVSGYRPSTPDGV